MLAIVAETVQEGCDRKRLQHILEHFRENSKLARGLLNGPTSPQVVLVLANLIEERLGLLQRKSGSTPVIPLTLVAMQAAARLVGKLPEGLPAAVREGPK